MPRRSSDEAAVSAAIALEFGRGLCRLLRNNVGSLFDRTGRPVAYGLGSQGGKPFRGTSDWIGWRSLVITPEMVGQRIAVFAAVETKDLAKASAAQERFIANVQAAGGIAGVAHNVDEARAILYPPHLPPV
jgi:hypothetical protein